MDRPLIYGDGHLAKEATPSAPPLPELISDQDFSTLVGLLRAEACNGFESQLRGLRIHLYGKVVHQGHAQQLLGEIAPAHRAAALQELYERQLLIDSSEVGPRFADTLADGGAMGLSAPEAAALRAQVQATAQQALRFLPEGQELAGGFDLSALPSAPPADFATPAPSAPPLGAPGGEHAVVLMHHEGRIATVVGDSARMDLISIMAAGCQHLNVPAFDPSRHYALMVYPGRRVLSDLTSPIASLGIPAWARILWLERPAPTPEGEKPADPRTAGLRFQQVRSTFFTLSQSNQLKISRGDMRNFFWNLNLEDGAFMGLWARLDTRGRGFLDIDDLLHLVGRAHMQHPLVPIDALLYEAATLIINKAPDASPGLAHFDLPIAEIPHGIGLGGACERHACSYFVSLILQIALPVLVVLLFLEQADSPNVQWEGPVAAVIYVAYLIHSFCCTKFVSAVGNHITGLDAVCDIIERPKTETPHFTWRIQCYHYETRTRTVTERDSDGNLRTRTVTERHRVNTWHNTHKGIIPSIDRTPRFIPNTTALVTEIDTSLDLDFTQSNYLQCYRHWCMANRFDLHADESRSEDLPSRRPAILAEWVAGARPCWMRRSAYALATLCLCSMCFRLTVQSRSGHQDFTYRKTCFRIDYRPPSRCHHGAAALLGGLAAGLAVGSVFGSGGYIS